jgi:hypothetical protein
MLIHLTKLTHSAPSVKEGREGERERVGRRRDSAKKREEEKDEEAEGAKGGEGEGRKS